MELSAMTVGLSDEEANVGNGIPDGKRQIIVGLPSNPPPGHYKVINIYVDSQTGKLVIQYETPGG
jgi:hypothetical protein